MVRITSNNELFNVTFTDDSTVSDVLEGIKNYMLKDPKSYGSITVCKQHHRLLEYYHGSFASNMISPYPSDWVLKQTVCSISLKGYIHRIKFIIQI